MDNIKDRLIKLGDTHPELRPHLRPLLDSLSPVSKEARMVTASVKGDIQSAFKSLNKKYGDQLKKELGKLTAEFNSPINDRDVPIEVDIYGFGLSAEPFMLEFNLEVTPEGRVMAYVSEREVEGVVRKVMGSSVEVNITDGRKSPRYGLWVTVFIEPELGTLSF